MCVWICDSLDDKTVEELCDNGNTTEGVLLWVYIMQSGSVVCVREKAF